MAPLDISVALLLGRFGRAIGALVALILVVGNVAACGQQSGSADCEKLMRFNEAMYSGANGEVSGLDRKLGVGVEIDCNDTVESPEQFDGGELQVWGLKGIEPRVAVAVVYGDESESEVETSILYVAGKNPCRIPPRLLEQLQFVGSVPCELD